MAAGGLCEFHNCHGGTCDGGGCKFNQHKTTLNDGYCDGGKCKLDGRMFPASFNDTLAF
jgi:hypothetical protein